MDPKPQTPPATSPASMASGPDLVGETFGDFHILRRLGQGGMGQVYLAEQISLKRKVAIKLLREDVAANPIVRERFQVESKTVAQLSHANIVQVYTVGEHAGRHYMVLEYVEGKSLRDYLLRKGPLDVPLVLSLMRQVASGLQRANEMGIVHRDIKPENILLTRKGEAKVADFGLSRCLALDQPLDLTRSGTTVGTPLYMSPEQVEGKDVDHRSDLYSFGVTCYHMLAGHPPFTGSNAFEVALKHVREEPAPLETVRPDIPPALCAIVRKLMAKKPQARNQSARELLKDIARLRESLNSTTGCIPVDSIIAETPPAEVTPPPMPRPVRKMRSRKAASQGWVPVLVVLGVVVGVFVAVGITLLIVLGDSDGDTAEAPLPPDKRAEPQEQQARAEALKKLQAREAALKKAVEKHLKESLTKPNPSGVQDCIELGVLYFEQTRIPEAEALFKRMDERRPPSPYHFVGRLGLAVTDALKDHDRAAQDKFRDLFNPKSRDNRVQILNTYLSKNAEFAAWVNEARSHTAPNVGPSPTPFQKKGGFPGWPKFKKK
ncbi:MAG: serine/threonine protein kinase [Gemmataceae bacterium]|nr:serine/threonine protein kinase [Gemmataceae bacterium]